MAEKPFIGLHNQGVKDLDWLFFRKIIAAFVVPPGLFVTVLLLGLFLVRGRRRGAGMFLLWFLATALFLLSSAAGEFLLVRPLEVEYPPLTAGQIQALENDGEKTAVVVLAGGVTRDYPGGAGGDAAEIGEATLKRVFEGFRIYRETGFPLLVSGGLEPGAKGPTLAAVMQQTLVQMGVGPENIILEDKSRTTLENAVNSIAILKDEGFDRMLLVTDAIHMRRSLAVFQGRGIDVVPCPSGYLFEQSPAPLDYLPNADSLSANLRAVHEWFGLAYYELGGR